MKIMSEPPASMELERLIEAYRLRPGDRDVKVEIYDRINELRNYADHVMTNRQTRELIERVLDGRSGVSHE